MELCRFSRRKCFCYTHPSSEPDGRQEVITFVIRCHVVRASCEITVHYRHCHRLTWFSINYVHVLYIRLYSPYIWQDSETRSRVTCAGNFVKFVRVVVEIYERQTHRQTHRQTDRQTETRSQYFAHLPARSNESTVDDVKCLEVMSAGKTFILSIIKQILAQIS